MNVKWIIEIRNLKWFWKKELAEGDLYKFSRVITFKMREHILMSEHKIKFCNKYSMSITSKPIHFPTEFCWTKLDWDALYWSDINIKKSVGKISLQILTIHFIYFINFEVTFGSKSALQSGGIWCSREDHSQHHKDFIKRWHW